jgi:hypothetical protein
MENHFEADVAMLHVAGGGARITPPPGTLAQTAPRRAARGRADDLFFISLRLHSPQAVSLGLVDHLARRAADAYYGTPGSVTSALREAAASANDLLVDANQDPENPGNLQGQMMAGVLRGKDLYLSQCGVGQAIMVRPGQVVRLTSEEAASRPLGLTLAPYIRFHHWELKAGDLIIMTTAPPPLWSEATLSGLSGLNPAQAVDRLVAALSHDLTGLLMRIVREGEASLPLMDPGPRATVFDSSHREAEKKPAPVAAGRRRRSQWNARVAEAAFQVRSTIRSWSQSLARNLMNVLQRMAPGLAEPLQADAASQGLLIATAIAIPLIVVLIAAVIYFSQGRAEQFQVYLAQASESAQRAQSQEEPQAAREDWEAALQALDLAAEYGENDQARELRQQVQTALDSLNLVVRLDFQPVVSGGFGPNSKITALAASTTDLYVLDSIHQIIFHAWGAPERGYEIDANFNCLGSGVTDYPDVGSIVDIVIQRPPGALGKEGVVAIDADGTLLYCAPDSQSAVAQLTSPDTGWGRIQSIDVFEDRLYVLDNEANSVWIYDARGGLFSGTPAFFFAEAVRDLSGAIDIAMAQDELFVLYADGKIDRCRRISENNPDGSVRIRVECDPEPRFQDDRPGFEASPFIPGAVPLEMSYSPPPEPSLYFLDSLSNSAYHYSMRLVYQGQYVPQKPFKGEISAMTLGPPNDLFLAVDENVYHAQPIR